MREYGLSSPFDPSLLFFHTLIEFTSKRQYRLLEEYGRVADGWGKKLLSSRHGLGWDPLLGVGFLFWIPISSCSWLRPVRSGHFTSIKSAQHGLTYNNSCLIFHLSVYL
ncbi:hypothetical protein BO86DRAFT_184035 [Aspergillus japonicus CBS 114.51]|uniref:Uncharacterized protein n=2 Tax=Aspergillus TaxID=5052 RepID=A0A2V5HJS9_ASPV1|nr:hypothetical protein BO86DRAFT_184035 [Aspergillus japonicus CBS 114.51]PYI24725.1 hypothetical protein BO99DRAFT_2766 [Aspergillus violaceofuscus CBS 115571]RAH78333.1 hypothetical protein BO86DRAFT_184035 [Aspergillus japonicus CBS 114.51]